jgi:hypothetical protein
MFLHTSQAGLIIGDRASDCREPRHQLPTYRIYSTHYSRMHSVYRVIADGFKGGFNLFDFSKFNSMSVGTCGQSRANTCPANSSPHHRSGTGFCIENAAVIATILADPLVTGVPGTIEVAFETYTVERKVRRTGSCSLANERVIYTNGISLTWEMIST